MAIGKSKIKDCSSACTSTALMQIMHFSLNVFTNLQGPIAFDKHYITGIVTKMMSQNGGNKS
jgi:hypothetical protein